MARELQYFYVSGLDGQKIFGRKYASGEVIEGAEKLQTLSALMKTGRVRLEPRMVETDAKGDVVKKAAPVVKTEKLGTETANATDPNAELPASAKRKSTRKKKEAAAKRAAAAGK